MSYLKSLLVAATVMYSLSFVSCGRGKVETISNADPDQVRAASEVSVNKGDWPWWSGPSRNFQTTDEAIPVKFDESTNCQWKYSIPGEGHASPIVIGDKVFLAVANMNKKTKSLFCIDRKTGEKVWDTVLHQGNFMGAHGKNSQASSTPASDGERVFTAFMFDNGIQVSAVDFNGNKLWQTTAGGFRSRHGYGSSPLIYRSLVIVAGDNPGSGFITAIDRSTGKIVWRINRTNESSYATPTLLTIDGKEQLVISGSQQIHGYDPANGGILWTSPGPAQTTANTVVSDGVYVFSGGGYPQNRFYAVDPVKEEIVWQVNLKNYVPSPVLYGDEVIIPQDGGILTSLSKDSGSENWKVRTRQDLSGSGILAGNYLYIGGENGTLFVVDLAGRGKILAKNKLDSRIMSTPAICQGQIFVRTAGTLFCFANSTIEKDN